MSLFPKARPTESARRPPDLPRVKTHLFVRDGNAVDAFGRELCECGSIREARIHALPPTPDDAAELDARRVPD